MTLKDAQHSLLENVAAISADFHTHSLYDRCYEIVLSKENGFASAYDICIQMAEALTDWELQTGAVQAIYDVSGLSWIEVVDVYVATLLQQMVSTESTV